MNAPILLTVDGEVEQPLALSLADLAAVDARFQVADVHSLAGGRRGTAVMLSGILELARPKPEGDYLTLHATADDFHASVPLADVRERGLFIYMVDGGPLGAEAGGPVRFFIPEHAACHSAEVDECANVKFVDRVEITAGRGLDTRPQDEKQHEALHEALDGGPDE